MRHTLEEERETTMDDRHVLSSENFDAVLFDLDGVITATASVHGAAWKQLFDGYLHQVAERDGIPFVAFEMEPDYRIYVDGKPRYEGVNSFLQSRAISISWGDPEDAADLETVCGLGNKKNIYFNEYLSTQGADIFDSSVQFVRDLIVAGIRVAVVSSSKNCKAILEIAGIADLFELRMGGVEAALHNIPGKPQPDTFLEASRRMGIAPHRAVVVEDAISGVQAGRAGEFGLVIGVDRNDEAEALLENGAHIVVKDLAELKT